MILILCNDTFMNSTALIATSSISTPVTSGTTYSPRRQQIKNRSDQIPDAVFHNRKNYDIQESNKKSGGNLFIHGQYGYCRNALTAEVLYLRCRLARQLKCRGSAKISFETCELVQTLEHTCGGSVDYIRGYMSKKVKGSKMVYSPLT